MKLQSLASFALAIVAVSVARAGECPPDTLELAAGDCDYEIRCVYVAPDPNQVPPEIVSAQDPPTAGNTLTISCDACDTPAPGLDCLITQGLSYTETATVSHVTTWGAGVAGTLNVALAGAVGVEATAAFSQGQTDQTSFTVTFTGECGVSGLSCAHRRYELKAMRRTVTARIPVYTNWEFRYTGGPAGCLPSGWLPLHPCPNAVYDTISADDSVRFLCTSKDLGPCCTDICPCCDDIVPHE